MRAVRIERFGGPGVLDVAEVGEPEPGPGEVLIRAEASAINPVDDKTRAGAIGADMPLPPMTLGWDLAGIVVDAGSSGLRAGDRVIAMSHQLATGRGTWADLVVLAAEAVALAPRDLDPTGAATLPLPGLTALQSLDRLALAPGERLLIAGAAGAVGGLALQIARARGIAVDALVSRDAQLAFAREHGAAFATTDPAALPERGYHAVFDTFGAFATGAVADGGRYVSVATQAGPVPDLSARGVRTAVGQVREDGAGLRELAALADRGLLRPRVDSVFALGDVRAAHERFARGGLRGKVAVAF
ncbi:NADPH:quinone reductase [Actinorhabdospora filicis]|uniref:NADPH:quinone reductase n=1 Tax=Actinorhabdospora filicis TaxID=1785913 RepID=A0A9W6W2U6_9ACTN|nr:NADP-dependent oxidoreductase [Actinorhabdospora filicis]GLZ77407.1 NADPH:quinone reductase [Actinorhabdospora filicis]